MNQWHNDLAKKIALDGEWQFRLGDQSGTINVPGTWEAQGYPRYVDGPAVYEKAVDIPADWQGQTIQLQFDAVSYHVEIEVNGTVAGTHTGLWTPFALDISEAVKYGESNTIRLTMYKPGERFPMRESLAGFLPDVCLPFGGIWQSARIVAFPGAAISDVFIQAGFGEFIQADFQGTAGLLTLERTLHKTGRLTTTVEILGPGNTLMGGMVHPASTNHLTSELFVEDIVLWSPEHPVLYTVKLTFRDKNDLTIAETTRKIGFRRLTRDGDALLLNDTPIFLRGVLNWGWYPEILCPAPDEQTIRDEFRRVKAAGYNMVKLCLYVPSQLYFDIADEEGMLLWLELPMWLPQVTERLRKQAPEEYADILAAVHHHPSIIIYSLGCEMNAAVDGDLLGKLNAILRERTTGVLVCDNSGSGEAYGGLGFDYADFNDYHFYADLHYFNPLVDHFRRDWRPARPWIFGEFCDADDFRDIDEIAAAKGEMPWWLVEQNPLHPFSFIAYSQQPLRMPELDIPFDAQALQRISRRQSFVVRKTILEKVRAHASMGGYVVTGIRDTPLATSSMFDDLGRPKYNAEIFREFNDDSVLVLERGRRRSWKNGGDRPAPLDKYNFMAGAKADFRIVLSQTGRDLPAGTLAWRLYDSYHHKMLEGASAYPARPASHIPAEIASIAFTTPETSSAPHDEGKPHQYTLEVELENGLKNHWRVWVYPPVKSYMGLAAHAIYDPTGTLTYLDDVYERLPRVTDAAGYGGALLICGSYTPDVLEYVRSGKNAIVLQPGAGTIPTKPVPFWREAIKLFYDHIVLSEFPHKGYADLQFYHLATDYAIDSHRFASQTAGIEATYPAIQRLDARAFTLLDYLVEFKIGAGRLMASTLRFGGGAGDQVNGLQNNVAARYLLDAMIAHYAMLTM